MGEGVKDVPGNRAEFERKGEMRLNLKAVVAGTLAACATLMTMIAVLYARPAAGAQPPPAADPAAMAGSKPDFHRRSSRAVNRAAAPLEDMAC